jgi:hypothetical protein
VAYFFFLIGQLFSVTCYQTSLLWDSHYFNNALLVFEVKKKHFLWI